MTYTFLFNKLNTEWNANFLRLQFLKPPNTQIQPGLKAKLWLIIPVNKKKLNCVMLNRDENENGFKTNRSNQQINKLHMQHTFSSNQQKTNLHVQHAFLSFSCRCFARLQRCFERLKRQTSQLHIIFMEELSYVLTQYFVSCVHVCFYFSLPLIFTLLAASISHFLTAALNFHVFLPTKFVSFVFNNSLQLFLCYPRQCKHKK